MICFAPKEVSIDADQVGEWLTTRYISFCLGEKVSIDFTLNLLPIPTIKTSIYDVENDEEWDLKEILKRYFHSLYQRIVGILTEWEYTAKQSFKHVMNIIIESIREKTYEKVPFHVPLQ